MNEKYWFLMDKHKWLLAFVSVARIWRAISLHTFLMHSINQLININNHYYNIKSKNQQLLQPYHVMCSCFLIL